jgi:hypothetical protein
MLSGCCSRSLIQFVLHVLSTANTLLQIDSTYLVVAADIHPTALVFYALLPLYRLVKRS